MKEEESHLMKLKFRETREMHLFIYLYLPSADRSRAVCEICCSIENFYRITVSRTLVGTFEKSKKLFYEIDVKK